MMSDQPNLVNKQVAPNQNSGLDQQQLPVSQPIHTNEKTSLSHHQQQNQPFPALIPNVNVLHQQQTNISTTNHQLATNTTNKNKSDQPTDAILDTLASQINSPPSNLPNVVDDNKNDINPKAETVSNPTEPNPTHKTEQQSQQNSPQKAIITKVKLQDEMNIFDWFRTTDLINQIAEKAKSSVDSVITVLDPGMKEYLYSGGNINIIAISDSSRLVSPIRDAFQSVFGRATVTAVRYDIPEAANDFPVKIACGFDEAVKVAQERIRNLRSDTNTVPQNQVILAVQPCLVNVVGDDIICQQANNGLKLDESLIPKWFLTYCMLIEDPVLGSSLNSYSQFIPIDTETVAIAKQTKFPENLSSYANLGFAISISDLMESKLNIVNQEKDEERSNGWLEVWSGLNEGQLIHNLSTSLAHLYRRKWSNCIN